MPATWDSVASNPDYQALPPDQQEVARQQYFDSVIAPQVPKEHLDVAKQQFDSHSAAPKNPEEPGFFSRVGANTSNNFQKAEQEIQDYRQGNTGATRAGYRALMDVTGGNVGSVFSEGLKSVTNAIPQSAKNSISQGAQNVADYIDSTDAGKALGDSALDVKDLSNYNQDLSKDTEALINNTNLLGVEKPVSMGFEGASLLGKSVNGAAPFVKNVASETVPFVKNIVEDLKNPPPPVLGSAAAAPKPPAPMTYSALKENSNNLYKEAKILGGGFSPKLGEDITQIAQSLKDTGFKDGLRPEAEAFNKKLDYYSRANTSDMSLADFQKIDKDLNADISAYNRAGELDYAKDLNDLKYTIRDMVKNPDYLQGSPEGVQAALNASNEWSRSLKMRDLEKIKKSAELSLNPKTVIQTKMKNLLLNDNKMRAYTEAEKQAIEHASKTGIMSGFTNLFANKAVDAVAGAATGAMGGGALGAGMGAVAGNATASGAAKLAGKMQAARTNKLASEIMKSKGGYKEGMSPQALQVMEREKNASEAAGAAKQADIDAAKKASKLGIQYKNGGSVKKPNLTAEFLATKRKRA